MARPSWLRAAAAMVIAASTLGRCTQVEKGGLDERAAEEARQRLDQRDSCNADNLLRLMRGTQHLADSQAFCTSYNCAQAPTVTTTVYYVSRPRLADLRTACDMAGRKTRQLVR